MIRAVSANFYHRSAARKAMLGRRRPGARRNIAALRRFRGGPCVNGPRTGCFGRIVRVLAALAAALPLEAHPEDGGTFMVGACKFETIGPGVVAGIVDARTLLLEGGRQARLAAIEVDVAEPATGPNALLSSLLGRDATLRRIGTGAQEDRYGRLLVQLFVDDAGTERWIQ